MKLFKIFVVFLQHLHKRKGHRASMLLFIFWLMITIFAAPQLRWEIRRFDSSNYDGFDMNWDGFQFINYCAYFSLVTLMLILNCFADKEPKNSTYPKGMNPSPELRVGAFIKMFFLWFEPVAWKGYKRPLTADDIYDIMPANASAELVPKFDKNFEKSLEKSRR
jgi:ATP-binding cassette subfamily C (CFTR/MRP) protein 1